MLLIHSDFSKMDLNNLNTLSQTTKYKTVIKNKLKSSVQYAVYRIYLALEIDLSYIRLAVNAVESAVEYYLVQRQTNKAKESILGRIETSVLAWITKC